MDDIVLGSTGLHVSPIGLGTVSFGDPAASGIDWLLDEEEASEIIDRAIDLGINFFDTANRYSMGESERILGNALSGYDREKFVVGTKLFTQMDPENRNSGGLSRKAIEQEIEHSLDRLGMDTVDICLLHRWDYNTPIEETLSTMTDLVRRQQVRYLGGSTMHAYQFIDSIRASERTGLETLSVMQNLYNLVYREEEREMLPFCLKEGVAVTPWSPLASGFLARPYEELEATERGEQMDRYESEVLARYEQGVEINERVQELAAEEGASMAQISLAWLLHKDWVDAPIVGATKVEHLEDAVEATELDLADSDVEWLEDPYEPVEPLDPEEDQDPRR